MRTGTRIRAAAAACALVGATVTTGALHVLLAAPAAAQSAEQARRAVQGATARVDALDGRVRDVRSALDAQQAEIGRAVSTGIRAQVAEDTAARDAEDSRRSQARRVRDLYMGGTTLQASLGLWHAALTGADVLLAQRGQQLTVDAALDRDTREADDATRHRETAEAASAAADTQTYAAIARVRDLADASAALTDELARAEADVAALSTRARDLEAAEAAAAAEAARKLAEARAAAEAAASAAASAGAAATSKATARPVAADYAQLYAGAARTCPGMRVSLLAAVGQVESGHGRNTGPSSAGAIGPMQFMPATFAAYGVDGDGDGTADAWAPADAVYSAANYLCRNGGGHGREAEARALWHYNHADWYVRMVQRIADEMDVTGAFVR
ncbi:lytic transglycosylase domain-containing protein [Kineococcus sp. NUM-3379]